MTQSTKDAFLRGLADGDKQAALLKPPPQGASGPKPQREPSDNQLAERFVSLYKDKVRYVHALGCWYIWVGTHWQKDERGTVFDAIRRCNKKSLVYSVSKTRNAEAFAQSFQNISVAVDVFDRNDWLLGTVKGTIDLRNGELRPPDPKDYITMLTAVAPAEVANDTTCKRYLEFMQEITFADEELILYDQKWLGYGLTGDTSEQCLAFWFGPGGNGKGVLAQTVQNIVGDYAHEAAIDLFIESHNDRHPTSIAALRGKRMVFAAETKEGREWNIGLIKQLTGDDCITAHLMRQDDITFKPRCKLTILGNYKPRLANVGEAELRRFRLQPFNFIPLEVDPYLVRKLTDEEGPGILRWMIDGCLSRQKNGMEIPCRIEQATREYFDNQNTFARWIEDCIELLPGSDVGESTTKLFNSWKFWAETKNIRVRQMSDLVDRLKGPPYHCRYTTNLEVKGDHGQDIRTRGLLGIRLLTSAPTTVDSSELPF
jgi:putative DNA primase/helicase